MALRFILLGLSLSLLTCSSNKSAHKPQHKQTLTVPKANTVTEKESPPEMAALEAVELSPSMVEPYFTEGLALKGYQAYVGDDWNGALTFFNQALDASSSEDEKNRLKLMIAVCHANKSEFQTAAQKYEASIPDFPLLSSWLHYQSARAYSLSGQSQKALNHASKVAVNASRSQDAMLLIGDELRKAKKSKQTYDHYKSYLDAGHKLRRQEATYYMAESAFALGNTKEALTLWRKIFVENPESRWGKSSKAMHEEHNGLQALGPLTKQDLLTRGQSYFSAMRNEESEADFSAARQTGQLSLEESCVAAYHQGTSVFRQRNRTKAVPVYKDALVACENAKNDDLYVKTAYQLGRSYGKLEKDTDAIKSYDLIETHHPAHSYADDARLRKAHEFTEKGDNEKAVALWSSIAEKYPEGDMKGEAAWRVAWHHYKKKNYSKAIKWLKKEIELEPIVHHWERTGQAQYWLGRSYAHQNKTKQSVEYYLETIRLYPLSYYSLLALNRLRESAPKAFKQAKAQMASNFGKKDSEDTTFKARKLYATKDFERGLTFLRLGLHNAAEVEFNRLGLSNPPHRKKVEDLDKADKIWATAYLNHHAKRYTQSHWVTRWHVLDYRRNWPVGTWSDKWKIAYPKGYWELLNTHAKQRGYPTELQIAFVREESAFDPKRESWANAHGLTQMIFSTAKRFAKGTGIEATRENLFDPEKNVIIGANFLGFLMKKWSNQVGLVVPSYNAGEGATTKWRRTRRNWPQDEFAEQIPYDETRRYNKRVTESYFAYSYIYNQTIPVMPNKQP